MIRKVIPGLCVLILVWAGPASASLTISLCMDPPHQYVELGDTADVTVQISGLEPFAALSLGAFDLKVTYDPSIISFFDVSFVDQLDILGNGSLQGFDDTTPGVVNVFEVSLDSAADLHSLQKGSFDLFTLTFDTVNLGTSLLNLTDVILADANGDPLIATTCGAGIKVIPAPTALLLSGIGLGIVNRLRRRRTL